MLLRLSTLSERLRSSLFFVPMAFVVVSIGLGVAGLLIDANVVEQNADLPFGMTSTVDSARAVLSTIAGATITFAGIAFSVALLLILQASGQYSPRVIQGLFRDPFNKRIMGIVVGTFTYCLVVLRSVRGPLEQDGQPVIPNLSVAVAVFMGVVSILSIVAFISHSAHAMDVSKILQNVSGESRGRIELLWRTAEEQDEADDRAEGDSSPSGDGLVVTLDQSGWIQQIDVSGLARAADPGGTVRVAVAVGRYAIPGTPLCTIDPAPDDPDAARDRARRSIVLGDARTTQQDVSYGIRKLADVALKALSPGINDPTTAQDALFHLGGVLNELLARCPPPARRVMDDDRVLEMQEELSHDDLVDMAFDEVRLAARGLPTVCIYLLEVLHLLDEAQQDPDGHRACGALIRQAELVRDGADGAGLLDHDRDRIRQSYEKRFGGR